uniref:G protein-coupled receptor 156 n=1 Tax=Xiphophorus couchianus TaxID=32473 RepID=A0A3B5MVR3_9TELE
AEHSAQPPIGLKNLKYAESLILSKEHLLCPICLDVFNQPVSTPCGHNFCRDCIQRYWQSTNPPQCPMCKHKLYKRPDLKVNTFISELLRSMDMSGHKGEVACDVCIGKRVKAFKTCLECLASFCQTHLEPHHVLGTLKKHTLINPIMNMRDRLCKKHESLLNLFCHTDQMYVCQVCVEDDHKAHRMAPIKHESQDRRDQIRSMNMEVQEDIHSRLEKTCEIAKQRCVESRASEMTLDLEQEINQLTNRSTDLELLSQTNDDLYLLQSFPAFSTKLPIKDWSGIWVESAVYVGTVRRALRRAESQLEETIKAEVKRLCKVEFERVKAYAVDVTLDPDTAHPKLVLSENRKQVYHSDVAVNLPDNPARFYPCVSVLGKEGFCFGRFSYEVQVKGKTERDIGVGLESVNRKGGNLLNPERGYWTLGMREDESYWALSSPPVRLPLVEKPQAVLVYVDMEVGQVSFYNSDSHSHIYTYTGYTFSERLFPYFNPRRNHSGVNSAPLLILPLNI